MTAEQAISWLTLKPKDLPVFVLLGSDPLAPESIEVWGSNATRAGVPLRKIIDAGKVLEAFHLWPEKKLPG